MVFWGKTFFFQKLGLSLEKNRVEPAQPRFENLNSWVIETKLWMTKKIREAPNQPKWERWRDSTRIVHGETQPK